MVFILVIAVLASLDFTEWRNTANALARYFIGVPAALLAAYGLRQQALHRIAPLNVPSIVKTLRVAGIALILYALFAGLISPPVGFFPGNVLNTESFERVVGVPPIVFRSLIGLILAITIFRALEIFDVENARNIEMMEQKQILAAERERIARDLHDGAIQTVYIAGLLVESAHRIADPESRIAARLERAVTVLNDAIRELRRNLDQLKPCPTEESLNSALCDLAKNPRFQSMVNISLDYDIPETEVFTPVQTDHIASIANEALTNVVRHARAKQVHIGALLENGRLILTIQDDGIGLPKDHHTGYGIRNMRDRARLLGGQLIISIVNGGGTSINLDIPKTDER